LLTAAQGDAPAAVSFAVPARTAAAGHTGRQGVAAVGHVEVAHVSYTLPDGRVLLDDVSFRIGAGVTGALVGPNGAGKTTLLRLISGDIPVQTGTVGRSGSLGVMRQFVERYRAMGAGMARTSRVCVTCSCRPLPGVSRRRASGWTWPSSP